MDSEGNGVGDASVAMLDKLLIDDNGDAAMKLLLGEVAVNWLESNLRLATAKTSFNC